ncbi:Polyketide methyltransferase sdnL [Rhypophila decipiens]
MTTTLQQISTGPPTITVTTNSPMANVFNAIRLNYDAAAKTAKAVDYWKEVYPLQARLVVAYIVEAFAANGLDLSKIQDGAPVPSVPPGPTKIPLRHQKLVGRLYQVLEQEGNLILSSSDPDNSFIRTAIPVDPTPSSVLYQSLIGRFQQHHDVVHELLNAIGSQLAGCLSGSVDALHLVFGNSRNKKLLNDMYEFWPLLRAPTLLLGDFLVGAVAAHHSPSTGSRPFRVLEVGAGTGGTTRHLVELLLQSSDAGQEIEYHFTDISPALVAAAKRQFKKPLSGKESRIKMSYQVLDIEKQPKEEYLSQFDCVISTNCIHATKDLDVTLRNLKSLLRPGSGAALMLVETTQKMCWLDIVVGFFGGWWAFEDGREYALIGEHEWKGRMKKVGFGEVLWTEGAAEESKIVRLIGGFL